MAAGAPGAATKRLPDHLDSFRLTDRRRNVDPLAAPTPGTATVSTGGANGYNNRPLQEARFDSFQEIVIPADLPNPSLVLGDAPRCRRGCLGGGRCSRCWDWRCPHSPRPTTTPE